MKAQWIWLKQGVGACSSAYLVPALALELLENSLGHHGAICLKHYFKEKHAKHFLKVSF